LRAIVPAVADAGHDVTVIANAKEPKSFTAEDGRVAVRHFRLPSRHWYSAKLPLVKAYVPLPLRQFEWSRAFYREAARVAAQRKIDVIESTEAGSLFLNRVAPLVIRLHGSERTFRQHSGLPLTPSVRCNDWLEAIASKRASAITSPSEFHANEMTRRRGWPDGQVRVIPNPISQTLVNAATAFHRNGNSERIVLYTGRLSPVKGIQTLLDAAKLVRASDPTVTFVLAGPWQMPMPPHSYGLTLNQQSVFGVRWIGPIEHKALFDWYRRAALFVMPSFYESFGISVLEAMAFGLPTVCTRVGSAADACSAEKTNAVVEAGNPQQLAAAVTQLLNDSKMRLALGSGARNHILQELSPAEIVRRNLSLYGECAHLSGRN